MSQQIINVGTAPNDGQGDPIRNAFIKCNDNFTQLFNQTTESSIENGLSNVKIPLANSNVLISVNGSANVLEITSNGANVTGNLSVTGNITGGFFTGNGAGLTGVIAVANVGVATQLANGISSLNIPVSNGNIVGTVNGVANVLVLSSTGVSVAGNITGNYFLGNGSQLTGVTVNYSNANVVSLMSTFGSNVISTTGNVTGNFVGTNFSSSSNIDLSATDAVRVVGGTFRLPPFTTAQLANITGVPGDLVYNTTVNKVQAWQYDATNTFTWVSLAVSTYQ
jgi:hypothetical protein